LIPVSLAARPNLNPESTRYTMSDSLRCLSASLQRSERLSQTTLALRLGGAGIILIVSAVASSFPSLAKREPRLGPPDIVFFIGKHFGTGKDAASIL
jgi:hypothetical protein